MPKHVGRSAEAPGAALVQPYPLVAPRRADAAHDDRAALALCAKDPPRLNPLPLDDGDDDDGPVMR